MAASGFTPIQLYRTTTATVVPLAADLAAGELAINTTDEKLYFKNAGGTVKLLASNLVGPANGGTGVSNNAASTLAISGNFATNFTVSGAYTYTFPGQTSSLGYLNIPQSGSAKTTSYALVTTDIGKVIEVGTGGSITVPNATFAAGDAIIIFNNTSGSITMTMTITNAYIAGTDADKATIDVATRGVANILFVTGTTCVVTGNVS